ncbi:MAG: hypothetical protein LBI06_08860 [Treponema sp.]|jgi:hypothetical protein|nr:hypothetical protein [Treponema sp.]
MGRAIDQIVAEINACYSELSDSPPPSPDRKSVLLVKIRNLDAELAKAKNDPGRGSGRGH